MGKHSATAVAVLGILAIAAATWTQRAPLARKLRIWFREPAYLRMLQSPEEEERIQSIEWLEANGSERAIPHLLEFLRENAREHWEGTPVHRAGQALTRMGPKALTEYFRAELKEGNLVPMRWSVLASLDSEKQRSLVPIFLESLDSPDERVRWDAVTMLHYAKDVAQSAVPRVTAALEDTSQMVRILAALFLADMGAEADVVLPVLLEAVEKGWAGVHFAALKQIAEYGPKARGAIPVLVAVVRTRGKDRTGAAKALGRMGRLAVEAIPALKDAIADEDPKLRQAAREALEAIRTDGP